MIEYLSPSSINSFINNYQDWYKHYILGEETPDNVYFAMGTASHEFLEKFFQEAPMESETIKQFATRRFNILFSEINTNERLINFFKETDFSMKDLNSYLNRYIKTWILETQKLEKRYGSKKAFEYNSPKLMEFEIKNEELKIRGYLDALFTEDRFHKPSKTLHKIVVDYKTSSKTMNTLHIDYIMQMLVYVLALKKCEEDFMCDWVCIDYLKYNQKYFFRITSEMLVSIEQLIKDVWEEVKKIQVSPEEYKRKKHKIKIENYL